MFEGMKGDVVDIIVQCGDCNWRGPSKMLTKDGDGLAYCPKCGREFYKFPPTTTPNTSHNADNKTDS